MLKIKEGFDLKELKRLGFAKDCFTTCCNNSDCYTYYFLSICPKCREILIMSGVDGVNGCDEINKLYDLITSGLVEKVEEE